MPYPKSQTVSRYRPGTRSPLMTLMSGSSRFRLETFRSLPGILTSFYAGDAEGQAGPNTRR
jgi:hypothetical protein